jgi:hypothetical protein
VRFSVLAKIFTVTIVFALLFLIINRKARNHLFPYFNTSCLEYKQKDFSRRLNDKIVNYLAEAKRKGIRICKDERDLRNRISEGKLVKVRSGSRYLVENMTYSNPYVTRESKILLDEIAGRFTEKVSQKGLKRARLIVTSMTRKTENVRTLRKRNSNSSENSPHLYGNAFDITYKRFSVHKWRLTECDKKYLKDALGEVIWQLKKENKCFATYERMQNCYHVVAR